jgi:hypothetical protein
MHLAYSLIGNDVRFVHIGNSRLAGPLELRRLSVLAGNGKMSLPKNQWGVLLKQPAALQKPRQSYTLYGWNKLFAKSLPI